MSSQRRLAANRRNAQSSTGPQSAEGRRASSLNALKFGLFSQQTILPDENPAEYKEMLDVFNSHYRPATPADDLRIQSAVNLAWRSRRFTAAEAAIQNEFAGALAARLPALSISQRFGLRLMGNDDPGARYARLARVIDSHQRALSRALAEVDCIEPCLEPLLDLPLDQPHSQPAETSHPAEVSESQPQPVAEVIPFPAPAVESTASGEADPLDKTNPIPKSDTTQVLCTEPPVAPAGSGREWAPCLDAPPPTPLTFDEFLEKERQENQKKQNPSKAEPEASHPAEISRPAEAAADPRPQPAPEVFALPPTGVESKPAAEPAPPDKTNPIPEGRPTPTLSVEEHLVHFGSVEDLIRYLDAPPPLTFEQILEMERQENRKDH